MALLDFFKKFSDEQACKDYLKLKRQEEGITCKKCGCKKHYWFKTQELWKCSNCGYRTTLRSGTIMENTKMPLQYWFMVIHLLTSTKKSFSALEIQRQLGHNRYEPIWYMVNKIRIVMGNRDAKYSLNGNIEMDDAYFEIVNLDKPERTKLNFGRGSDKQLKVLITVESTPVTRADGKIHKHKPMKRMGYVKMQVIDNLKNESVNYEVAKMVNPETAIIESDAWRGYSRVKNVVKQHNPKIVPFKEGHKHLPWVHTVIANAKRLLLGTHHSIGKDYLQNYLNEYCYKLNRRYDTRPLFDRMIVAGIEKAWY